MQELHATLIANLHGRIEVFLNVHVSGDRYEGYTVMESILQELKGLFSFMTQSSPPDKNSANKNVTRGTNVTDNQSAKEESTNKNEQVPPSVAKDKISQPVKEKKPDNKVKKTDKGNRDKQEDSQTLINRISDFTNSAFNLAKRTTGTSLKVGKAIVKSQDQLKLMLSAGQSLKDLREVAGLTLSDLNDALNLRDKTLLEAVENGTATLSFELILRLAALLARNDPVPFVLKFTRTYNPDIWRILHDWGLGRLPLHYERERLFINIYRSHDAARNLSDEGFDKVLEFTRKAFEMSLHFIAEQESIDLDAEGNRDTTSTSKESKEAKSNQNGNGKTQENLSE